MEMSDGKTEGHSASKPAISLGIRIPAGVMRRANEEVSLAQVIRNFCKKSIIALPSGGICRRLLLLGLSLFCIVLPIVVFAGYFFIV